jgi:hypothetical protein
MELEFFEEEGEGLEGDFNNGPFYPKFPNSTPEIPCAYVEKPIEHVNYNPENGLF